MLLAVRTGVAAVLAVLLRTALAITGIVLAVARGIIGRIALREKGDVCHAIVLVGTEKHYE